MSEALVSIITPSYNTSKFIAKTIESVLNQTYQNWEMIIVDDGSTDSSKEIIETYMIKDSRLKMFETKQGGPAIARNKAIKEASGRFIAFLDSDDLWKPEKLEIQIEFMNKHDCVLSYGNYNTISEEGINLEKQIKAPDKVSYNDMLKSNFIGCLTAVYDAKEIGKIYLPILSKGQDYGLWLNILKKTDYAYRIDEVMGSYRIRSNSITRNANKYKLLQYQYELYTKHEKFSIIKSLYYIGWNILFKVRSYVKK